MLARVAAFAVWALVAATAVFWGLRLTVRPQSAPAYAVVAGDAALQRGDLTRLLGSSPAPATAAAPQAPELAARFRLLGVMAGKAPNAPGFATIAVDSKPARTYAVGAPLDGDLVLQSVSLRAAAIGPAQGGPALTLEIPPLPAPATGTLPNAGDTLRPPPANVAPSPAIVPPPPQPLPPGANVPPPMPAAPGRPTRIPGTAAR